VAVAVVDAGGWVPAARLFGALDSAGVGSAVGDGGAAGCSAAAVSARAAEADPGDGLKAAAVPIPFDGAAFGTAGLVATGRFFGDSTAGSVEGCTAGAATMRVTKLRGCEGGVAASGPAENRWTLSGTAPSSRACTKLTASVSSINWRMGRALWRGAWVSRTDIQIRGMGRAILEQRHRFLSGCECRAVR
jgi:hypothetical protein